MSIGMRVIVGSGAVWHLLQGPLQPLRCTAAAGLIQVRGAKRKFGGIHVDPYNKMKKEHRMAEYKKSRKRPLVSEERLKNKIDLPYNITSLNHVVADVIPLEKYAKAPLYTKLGMRQRVAALKENILVIYAGGIIKRRLRKVDPFVSIEFARRAQEQFIEANIALLKKDKRALKRLMTENAASELRKEEHLNRTYTWEFVQELERPRIVSARVAPYNTKENLFAQVVVRLKSLQRLAVYSPNGSLLSGHPDTPSELINYVVLERHLVEPKNTSWRIMTGMPNQRPWQEVQEEEAGGKETVTPTPQQKVLNV